MSLKPIQPFGQLCIWTDTDADPQAEADFNAWYDREHMQERVGLPGFRHARRFLANDDGARRYLALYLTDSLDVFRSATYQQAFTVQTDWSLRNFARMTNTQRRVGELALEAGAGEGGQLALFVLPAAAADSTRWHAQAEAGAQTPGIHAVRMFYTDPELSAPLATAGQTPARAAADAIVLIEGSDAAATRALATKLAAEAGATTDDVRTFTQLWRLAA
ncbi:hypothetical protein [Paraburkholderia sp.]|uniref:hypothetical protein n=1 Tax=Paraburkholderia sp. TaxID=1926495 RepID=UPI003D6F5643